MRSMSILEEMLAMFATTVQAELNATLHVCESGIFLGLVPKEYCVTIAYSIQYSNMPYRFVAIGYAM
jgi:hypothetical protein